MSSSSESPTAAAIPPALFLLVPLFTIALVLLALSHRPRQDTDARPQARVAYAFIALLAVLSTLAGALPLSHSGAPLAEAVIQALLSFLLGVPVLHLASTPIYALHSTNGVLQITHTTILVITLLGATLIALILPSLSTSSPLYLPPALFLLYSLLALPRIAWTLFRFLHPPAQQSARSSTSSSAYFFNRTRSTTRRPITIRIETQRTSIPLSLPSPASSTASFPFSPETRHLDQHQQQQQEQRPIELEIALPKRKDSRGRLNDTDGRYLYQDEKKIDTILIEKHPQHQCKNKHEKSTSIDSTTSSASTITAVDHTQQQRHHRSLSPPPLPLVSLTTPPRAIYNYTSALSFEPAPFSSTRQEEHIYRFPDQEVTNEDAFVVIGSSAIHPGDNDDSNNTNLRARLTYSRSRSLLVFVFAAQLALVVGYACAVGGVDFSALSHSSAVIVSLKIVQAACTVLAVTGTMSAYLLHAYNTHLSPSRSRTRSRTTAPSTTQSQTTSSAFVYNNPISSSSRSASAPFSPNADRNNSNNTPSAVAMHNQNGIQIAEANTRPVLIQLAPPPPPRTRRKRVDGFNGFAMPAAGAGGAAALSMVAKERERMDLPRSVSISASASSSNGSNPNSNEGEFDPYSYSSTYSYPTQGYQSYGQSGSYQQTGYNAVATTITTAHNSGNHNHDYNHDNSHVHVYNDYNNANNLYARPTSMMREPITLTYEPPVMSGGMSLLEATETEGEGEEELDMDFEDIMDGEMDMDMDMEDMDGDLDLEGEMQKALSLSLSRSSSMATTMSGLSRESVKRRASMKKYGMAKMLAVAATTTTTTTMKSKPLAKAKSKSKKAMEDPATYIKKRGSVPVPSRSKRLFGWEFAWDPVPLPAGSRRGNGNSGSGMESVAKKSKGTIKEKEWEKEREVREAQDSSFMDLKGAGGKKEKEGGAATVVVGLPTRKLKRHSTPAGSLYRSILGGGNDAPSVLVDGARQRENEREKQEKWEEIFGARNGGVPATANVQSGVADVNAGSRKLKKMRSESASLRPATGGVPASHGFMHASSSSGSTLNVNVVNSNVKDFADGYHKATGGHRAIRSASSSSRPGTGDSSKTSYGSHANRASLGNGSNVGRGLQLKRSFKMSVGRTLGPGLTLASAGVVNDKEEREEEKARNEEVSLGRRRSDERESSVGYEEEDGDDVDVDVDGEIRSLAAARLVSASIARATPAATIVTAPSNNASTPPPSSYPAKPHSSPVNIAYPTMSSNVATRPVLPAIVTSVPIPIPTASAIPFPVSAPASRRPPTGLSPIVRSPTSARQPPYTSGSNWKPHPFADPAESSPAVISGAISYTTASSEGVASIEDDVVQLEREMEEIRGSRGDGNDAMDSPTIQLRELAAAMGVQGVSISASPPTPLMSSSMTPSVTSMFALAHAQAQTVGPSPTLTAATNASAMWTGAPEKTKNKIFGGGYPRKRTTLSAPPVSKSDWAPQSSAGSTGGFPYRFPMIFPHSFTGSPPRSSAHVNGQGQTSNSIPGTPRGGSTLRLSAMTMGTVRNAFAGVGARMSSATSRMSVNSAAGGSFRGGSGTAFGEMIMEDCYGDFMDLRDPFASPPPASNIAIAAPTPVATSKKKNPKSKGGVKHGDNFLTTMNVGYEVGVGEVPNAARKKMSAWGKLPVPIRSFSPAPSAGSGNVSSTGSKRHSFISGRIVGKPSSSHRKHKKERRARKAALPSMAGAMASSKAGAEDSDFGLEEALLSQRLLNRLDSDGWEGRL